MSLKFGANRVVKELGHKETTLNYFFRHLKEELQQCPTAFWFLACRKSCQ